MRMLLFLAATARCLPTRRFPASVSALSCPWSTRSLPYLSTCSCFRLGLGLRRHITARIQLQARLLKCGVTVDDFT
ncbi:hypothetical protein B0H19DRAFT_1119595 [Mycena capillaripes]|nr:hypothetical protein B0H19DRAFT_1119595 [Mycena capillaripes]